MRYWTALVTRRGEERRAASHVERQDFQFYLPQMAVASRAFADKFRGEIMFPGYLFVRLREGWHALASTRGVARMMLRDGVPVRVPNCELSRLRELEDDRGLVHLPERFRFGDAVRVAAEGGGALAGLTGVYRGMTPRDRCVVLLRILGKSVTAEVDAGSLVAA